MCLYFPWMFSRLCYPVQQAMLPCSAGYATLGKFENNAMLGLGLSLAKFKMRLGCLHNPALKWQQHVYSTQNKKQVLLTLASALQVLPFSQATDNDVSGPLLTGKLSFNFNLVGS